MVRKFFLFTACFLVPLNVQAQDDPLLNLFEQSISNSDDANKSVETLLGEAMSLFQLSRSIDARSKLFAALRKDPENVPTLLLLSRYYLGEVRHYPLAKRYLSAAQKSFGKKYSGTIPNSPALKAQHQEMIYLSAQIALNLDNYEEALTQLNKMTEFGYTDPWVPGSKAWVLMKLGRIDEAIRTAQAGYTFLYNRPQQGQLLNVLGILYSMSGQPELAQQVLQKAIEHEMSEGEVGDVATPLNNSGEVYKEAFQDSEAEQNWLRALSQEKGCDHVLPALNLAMMYIEQLNLFQARQALLDFEQCSIRSFPLKDPDEFRPLLELFHGRLDLMTGKLDRAIKRAETASNKRQSFGNMGTSKGDYRAAAYLLLAQSYRAKKNALRFSLAPWYQRLTDEFVLGTKSFWYFRKAREQLAAELNNFEDLTIRHTDSLLDYPTIGEVMTTMYRGTFQRRLTEERKDDSRQAAAPYYLLYQAEFEVEAGNAEKALDLINQARKNRRPLLDKEIALMLNIIEMRLLDPQSRRYGQLAQESYLFNRAALRNYGLPIQIRLATKEASVADALEKGPFVLVNDQQAPFLIEAVADSGGLIISFESTAGEVEQIKVSGNNAEDLVTRLIEEMFTEKGL